MKITYNINLDGRVFTIDEDAYRLLKDYLDTLKHAFDGTENQEIIIDIEARISEVFYFEQENGKSVVTLKDVEAVITRIGHPEELIEDISYSEENKDEKIEIKEETILPPPPPVQNLKLNKRLFRDSENGMIGGVCAGLAEYLNVDVTWVRLIAVALCFVSLSTLAFAYLILWIVLPNADTPLQRMQLAGQSPTLQNIGRSVKNFFNNQNERCGTPSDRPSDTVTSTSGKRFADGLAGFFGIMAKICLFTLMIIFIPMEVGVAIALLGCFIALIALTTTQGMVFVTGIPYLDGVPCWQLVCAIICAIGVLLFVGIPLFLLIRMLIYGDKKPLKKSSKWVALIGWIISIVIFSSTAAIVSASYSSYL